MLVEDIHSAAVATIGADGHPQIRTIDMMLWDDRGEPRRTAEPTRVLFAMNLFYIVQERTT